MTGVPVAAPKNAPPGFAALLCALVVAMTFIPLLGYYIQRPPARKEPTLEEKRQRGFYGFYSRLVGRAIQHRWYVLLGSFVFLLIGGFAASHLKSQFFPEDVQYWFYLDIWLPNDVPLSATNGFHLSRSDPDQLCAGHCAGARQGGHSKADWTSSR